LLRATEHFTKIILQWIHFSRI